MKTEDSPIQGTSGRYLLGQSSTGYARAWGVEPKCGGCDMSVFHVRPETTRDQAAVFQVERSAFGQPVQARLVDALRRNAEPRISLVAEKDGAVVGHIFFSPVSFDDPHAPRACQLSPLAVLPEVQRTGIGAAIVRAGLEACAATGWTAVFLLGDPRYYSRFGFEMAGNRGLVHSGTDGEFLQVLELEAGSLAGVSGEVRFHPVFDDFE